MRETKRAGVTRGRVATMHGLLALAFFVLAGAVGGGVAHATAVAAVSRT